MKTVQTEAAVLAIPDIHQNADFVMAVLRRTEQVPLTQIVLLGDILDGRVPETRTAEAARRTLDVLETLQATRPVPVIRLMGNHDWIYWQNRALLRAFHASADEATAEERLRAHSLVPETARALKQASDTFWTEAQLVHYAHGVCFSHAGVHPELWDSGATPHENVLRINRAFVQCLNAPSGTVDSVWTDAGFARGGSRDFGGPLWQDWEAEFEDLLPCPQVLGHSSGPTVRRRGRSYCIDTVQSSFALVYPDGMIQPHSF